MERRGALRFLELAPASIHGVVVGMAISTHLSLMATAIPATISITPTTRTMPGS
jgi:hypothetical protein